MTGELCSQPPLGVADTRLPNRSATSRWQVSPGPSSGAAMPPLVPALTAVGSPVPARSRLVAAPGEEAAGAKAASAKPGSRGATPSGAPGRSAPEACSPTSALRAAAYSADSSAASGTGVCRGSPYHASRSAKASLAASVTAWMKAALPGWQVVDAQAVQQGQLLQEYRPLAPRAGLADGQAVELSRHRRLGAGPPAGQVGAGQQAAVAVTGDVHDLGLGQVGGDRLGHEARVERLAGPPRSAVRGRGRPARPRPGCARRRPRAAGLANRLPGAGTPAAR